MTQTEAILNFQLLQVRAAAKAVARYLVLLAVLLVVHQETQMELQQEQQVILVDILQLKEQQAVQVLAQQATVTQVAAVAQQAQEAMAFQVLLALAAQHTCRAWSLRSLRFPSSEFRCR